jgi:hypothetical protein
VHLLWFGILTDNTAISSYLNGVSYDFLSLASRIKHLTFTQTHARVAAKVQTLTVTPNTVKPVNLATLVNRLPVTVEYIIAGRSRFYDIIYGHYCLTWPSTYRKSWPLFQI